MIDKIKFFLEDATIPIIGGIIGSFIGMGIAVLLLLSRKMNWKEPSNRHPDILIP